MSGLKMAKLDRFLVSANFFEHWANARVVALDHTISDHSPIKLHILDPKPLGFSIIQNRAKLLFPLGLQIHSKR